MLRAFLPAIDQSRARIQKTIETGVDPDGIGGLPAGPVVPPVASPPTV